VLVEAVGLSSSQMENSSALADVAPRPSTEDARPRVPAPANSLLRITNARSSELFQHPDGTSKVLKIFKQQESAMLQPYCVGIISKRLPVAFPLNDAPPDHLEPVRHRLRISGHRRGPSSRPRPRVHDFPSCAREVLPRSRCSAAAWAGSRTMTHPVREHAGQSAVRARWPHRKVLAGRAAPSTASNPHRSHAQPRRKPPVAPRRP